MPSTITCILLSALVVLCTASEGPCTDGTGHGCIDCLSRTNVSQICYYCSNDNTCQNLLKQNVFPVTNCSGLDYYIATCDLTMLIIVVLSSLGLAAILFVFVICCCCCILCCCCKSRKRATHTVYSVCEDQPLIRASVNQNSI
ncbi:hypothetical protein EMCRGX_G013073 [Ephydatia muelleri]